MSMKASLAVVYMEKMVVQMRTSFTELVIGQGGMRMRMITVTSTVHI